MATVRCQRVTIRAGAAERAGHVMTAEGALVSDILALVDVFANLVRSGCESVVAIALKSTFDVTAGTIATNVGNGTLVVICKPTNAKILL